MVLYMFDTVSSLIIRGQITQVEVVQITQHRLSKIKLLLLRNCSFKFNTKHVVLEAQNERQNYFVDLKSCEHKTQKQGFP